MARHRLGVVLLIAQPLATEVDGVRRALGDADIARIPPHMTLVPPVNVHDRDLNDALDVVRVAGAATEPFTVRIGPAATFHPVTPTVYLEVGGDVAAVHALRARVFKPPLERTVEHEFIPHVTLDADHAPDRIATTIAALGEFVVEVTFDRLHILREGAGHTWTPIADAPFGPPAVVGRGGLPLELTVSSRPDPEAAALLVLDGRGDGLPFAVTARRDDRVVGAVWGWTSGGVLELADIAVAAAARNQGVGGQLLAAVEDLGRRRDCSALTVLAPNTGPAAALLARAGWRSDGDAIGTDRRRWTRHLSA